jgi:hypothetical protein
MPYKIKSDFFQSFLASEYALMSLSYASAACLFVKPTCFLTSKYFAYLSKTMHSSNLKVFIVRYFVIDFNCRKYMLNGNDS